MKKEPCARLIRRMVPKASVTPTAIRNSISPSCRALKDCSARKAIDMAWDSADGAGLALEGARRVMRVFHVLLDDFQELEVELAVGHFLHSLEDDVLNRKVVIVEFEAAAQR